MEPETTSGKGTTLEQVNAALDELNRYADMTIYNFTEMTRNIGTFTAAGVDLASSAEKRTRTASTARSSAPKPLAAPSMSSSRLTASSWSYKIEQKNGSVTIAFYNSNIQNGVPIAIILQYGHGTRGGGWVFSHLP